jgi:hypothetical protein
MIATIKDPDMSGWEKTVSIMTSLGSVLMAVTMLFNAQTIATGAANGAAVLHALGLMSETTATEIQTGANVGLARSFGLLLVSMLPIVGIIGAIVIVGWLLAKAFDAIQKASPEGKLKAAQEAAENTADAINKVTEATENLSSGMDNLATARDTLHGLAKGSQEWNQ